LGRFSFIICILLNYYLSDVTLFHDLSVELAYS
jgi:hypothetical protein